MRIFADSGSDLPKSFFEENDVTLLPLRVLIDDKEGDDILEIDSKEVYDAIRNGKHPKTSQVSPEKFLIRLERACRIQRRWLVHRFFIGAVRNV